MKNNSLFAALTLTIMPAVVVAQVQTCNDAQPETAPAGRFKLNNGLATDTATGLVWSRCALGMRWEGDSCAGQAASENWNEARAMMAELNRTHYLGRSDWRLPTLQELTAIVEQRCFVPAINLTVFPYSPDSGFWTATTATGQKPRAWLIHFRHGGRYIGSTDQHWRVRPVAGGK